MKLYEGIVFILLIDIYKEIEIDCIYIVLRKKINKIYLRIILLVFSNMKVVMKNCILY